MRTALSSLLCVLVVAGCGGGGDGPARPDLGTDGGPLFDAGMPDAPTDDGGVPVDAGACATLALTTVVSGLNGPSCAVAPPGDDRLFVCERSTGHVKIVDASGAVTATPFLDVSASLSTAGYESGVTSLAFHPDYATHPLVYVSYTTATNLRVSSFTVASATASTVDTGSETTLLEIPLTDPMRYHTSGWLAFGPDGFLYVGVGDMNSLAVSQNVNDLHGKILRIDVDATPGPYGIPPSNPFVGMAAHREEIYAYGFREPYRFSFDSTGDLYVGEVGDGHFEEVDRLPMDGSAAGNDYGWPITEGNGHCHTPSSGCMTSGLTAPLYEYAHSGLGNAIMGGYVYRGTALPSCWTGRYFLGDYAAGFVRSIATDATDARTHSELHPPDYMVSLGLDGHGEILILTDSPPAMGHGTVSRISAP